MEIIIKDEREIDEQCWATSTKVDLSIGQILEALRIYPQALEVIKAFNEYEKLELGDSRMLNAMTRVLMTCENLRLVKNNEEPYKTDWDEKAED